MFVRGAECCHVLHGSCRSLSDFIKQVTSNVQHMDAMYVVSWEDWFPKLLHCMPAAVMKPGDGDDDGKGESDSGQPVDAPPPPSPRQQEDSHQASQASDPDSSDDDE